MNNCNNQNYGLDDFLTIDYVLTCDSNQRNMPNIHIHDLINELHIPIDHIRIEGDMVYIDTVGTCLIKGNRIVEPSLNWQKIYELNKKKLAELINKMYQVRADELEITPKPNRLLELKLKGQEMSLPSVQYIYNSNGEWTLQRGSIDK